MQCLNTILMGEELKHFADKYFFISHLIAQWDKN